MTGNWSYIPHKNGDGWGMVQMALFYPHYTIFLHGRILVMSKHIEPAYSTLKQGYNLLSGMNDQVE